MGFSTLEMRLVSTPEQDQHRWMVEQEKMEQLKEAAHEHVWRMTVAQFEQYVQVVRSDIFFELFDEVVQEVAQEEFDRQNERKNV